MGWTGEAKPSVVGGTAERRTVSRSLHCSIPSIQAYQGKNVIFPEYFGHVSSQVFSVTNVIMMFMSGRPDSSTSIRLIEPTHLSFFT